MNANTPGKCVVVSVADRSAPTLEAIIQQYVKPGSCLYSDMWKGYRTWALNDLGILHRTVNHTLFFKDPLTGIHTNTIEGLWSAVKHRMPTQARTVNRVDGHLWDFMWRRKYGSSWRRWTWCLKVFRYDAGLAVFEPEEVPQDAVGVPHHDEGEFWEDLEDLL